MTKKSTSKTNVITRIMTFGAAVASVCLASAPSCVHASGPGISVLNCGSTDMSLAAAYINVQDNGISSKGWIQLQDFAPAGKNSGKVPVPTDSGTFYFRIQSKGGEEVQLPLSTMPFCTHNTATAIDILSHESETCDSDGYEMKRFYEVKASDYSNGGSVGVYCTDDKCEVIQAGPENPVPVEYRDCGGQTREEIPAQPDVFRIIGRRHLTQDTEAPEEPAEPEPVEVDIDFPEAPDEIPAVSDGYSVDEP